MGSKVTVIKDVPSQVIKANKTDLTPGTIKKWSMFSLPPLLVHVPTFAKSYMLPRQQFEAALNNDPVLEAENAAIAGTLIAALEKDSEHVENMKEELTDIDPDASLSGYKILHAILSSEQCGKGIYRTSRVKAFKNKQFFHDAHTVEKVVMASNKALAEFKLLPETVDIRADTNADVKMLLSKMPITIAEQVAYYEKKIEKREAQDLPLKWSYKELTQLLAVDIVTAYINTAGTINTANIDKRRICVNCGSKDHIVTDKGPNGKRLCNKKCPNEQCQSGICPGLRGGVCVVSADEMPKHDDIKNAIGKTIPEHIYKWLVELRAEKRPAPTANIATMTANASTVGFAMF